MIGEKAKNNIRKYFTAFDVNGLIDYIEDNYILIERKDEMIDTVLEVVAEYYGITIDELLSPKRDEYIMSARRAFCYLSYTHLRKKFPHITLEAIGKKINISHGNVIYHYKVVRDRVSRYRDAKETVGDLETLLSTKKVPLSMGY